MDEDVRRIAVHPRATQSARKNAHQNEILARRNSQTAAQSNDKSGKAHSQRGIPVPSVLLKAETLKEPEHKQQRSGVCPRPVDFQDRFPFHGERSNSKEHCIAWKDATEDPEPQVFNACQFNEESTIDEVFYRDTESETPGRVMSTSQQDESPIKPHALEFEDPPILPTPNTSPIMAESNAIQNKSSESSPRTSMDKALKSEKAFIEYVMSLPCSPTPPAKEQQRMDSGWKQKSKMPTPTASSSTKVGLDHLDNLCKLMEQLSELRETNSKLQKRVQYLEEVKTLHEMHKEIRCEAQYGSENLLTLRRQTGLKKSMTSSDHVKRSSRGSEDSVIFTHPAAVQLSIKDHKATHKNRPAVNPVCDGRRRERSKSVGHEEAFDAKPKRIFPKWSKVKEAFGWDRSVQGSQVKGQFHEGPTDRKDSAARSRSSFRACDETAECISALKMPLYPEYPERDDLSHSESITGDVWRYNPALHSSAEDIAGLVDVYRGRRENYKRYSETSDKQLLFLEPPSEGLRRQKSTPSPGSERGRHCQDIIDLKPKSLTIERDIDAEQAFAKYEKEDAKKPNKSPWGRVKTIIERRRDSLKRRHMRKGPEPDAVCLAPRCDLGSIGFEEVPMSAEDLYQMQDESPRRKSSDDQLSESLPHDHYLLKRLRNIEEMGKSFRREKPARGDPESTADDQQAAPFRTSKISPFQKSLQGHDIIRVVDGDYLQTAGRSGEQTRTPSSSPPFHRRSRWGRVKKVLKGRRDGEGGEISSLSMPASPDGIHDVTFDFEDAEIMEDEGEEERYTDDQNGRDLEKANSQDLHCYPAPREITRVGSDSFVHKLSLSSSAPVSDIMQELQRNLSDDFHRKIQEWERIRGMGGYRPTSPKWERKNSQPKPRSKKQDKSKSERFDKSIKPKIKDLSWLEKELQKIEKEKQRLSKEKQKYEERAFRLERLRQTVLTMGSSHKKEVLVRTSAGEFRFEGISDAFTKKLYEWETKRGVGPELSTIALLDSSLGVGNKVCLSIQQGEKCSSLQRAISKSESSLMEVGQPSHTSSNSLPSLKPPEVGDMDRIHHPSRASSEPDLHSISAIANSSNSSGNNFNCVGVLPQSDSFINVSPEDEGTSKDSLDGASGDPRHSYAPAEVTELIDCEDRLQERKEAESEMGENKGEVTYLHILSENVLLLEKLEKKEEICRTLEKELELLDEKVEEMNTHHQKEMERYREKLWEMHKPGNTPRDVQGCIEIISELKTRIEELEKCSERLKNDRENIQDSFRFHSEQQEHMTFDLLNKMRELQEAGREPSPESLAPEDEKGRKESKRHLLPVFDLKILERLQDLSSQLVQQTGELEQALAVRSQQICQLRWELLHRDVSTVRLETELHSAHIRGNQPTCRSKCEAKRSKYAHFRSWSSEEASNRATQQSEINSEFDRLPHRSQETYHNLTKADFQTTNLTCTVNELNKELLRLSTAAETFLLTNATEGGESSTAAETETVADFTLGQRVVASLEDNLPHISINTCHAVNAAEKRLQEEHRTGSSSITVRRNSVGNISSVSGPDASESSSLNELEWRPTLSVTKAFHHQQPKNSTSTSSESLTGDEESFTSVSWCHNSRKLKKTPVTGKEMILKHPSRKPDFENNDCIVMAQSTLERKALELDSKVKSFNRIGIIKSESARGHEVFRKNASTPKRSMSSREKREVISKGREADSKTCPKRFPLNLKADYIHSNNLKVVAKTKNSLKDQKKNDNDAPRSDKGKIKLKNLEFESWNSANNSEEVLKKGKDPDLSSVVVLRLPRKKTKPLRAAKSKIRDEAARIPTATEMEIQPLITETVTVILPRKRSSEDCSVCESFDIGHGKPGEVTNSLENGRIEEGAAKMCHETTNSFRFPYGPKSEITGVEKAQCGETNCFQTLTVADACIDDDIPERNYASSVLPDECISLTNCATANDQTTSKLQEAARREDSVLVPSEKTHKATNSSEKRVSANSISGCIKSPSAPQLDWKVACAKKTSRDGAPNVRALIEKYNKKTSVMPPTGFIGSNDENRCRKISDITWRNQTGCANGPQSPGNIPLRRPIYNFQSSLELKPTSIERLYSPPVSPPTSPASRARAEALQRAKEKFISSSNVATYKNPEFVRADSRQLSDSGISNTVVSNPEGDLKKAEKQCSRPEEDGVSYSSTRSMDSVGLVVYRTGESCQESRISRKSDVSKEKAKVAQDKQLCPSKSLSNSSVLKLVTGHDIRLPSSILNLKLKRSKKKKDMSTVSALCRQSLLVGDVVKTNDPCPDDVNDRKKSSRSCPSSPELKSKSKFKTSWLPINFFRQK